MGTALNVEGLTVNRGRSAVIRDVSITVDEGECVCLVGSNGAGKTSLVEGLLGILTTKASRVDLFGSSLLSLDPWNRVRAGLVIVPQDRGLFPTMTVKENLELGGVSRKARPAEIEETLGEIFTLFPRLHERVNQTAGTLSGGERSMLAISRGLMAKPRMLILDEPSLGLAPVVVASIMDTIRKINRDGTTIFLIEQNVHQAFELASRGYVVENGELVLSGTTKELSESSLMQESFLGTPTSETDAR